MTMPFHLPDLGEGITEAEVVRWLVRPGEHVGQDQEVVEVQTDKAVVALPTPFAGIITSLNAQEGEIVAVHSVLFTVEEEETATPTPQPSTSPISAAMRTGGSRTAHEEFHVPFTNGSAVTSGTANGQTTTLTRRKQATPVARRMARELGIDITTIQGTGPGGRVKTEDVQRAVSQNTTASPITPGKTTVQTLTASSAAQEQHAAIVASSGEHGLREHEQRATTIASSGEHGLREHEQYATKIASAGEHELREMEERLPLRGLRRRIAENMQISVRTIPQVTTMLEVEVSGMVALRESLLQSVEARGVKLSYLPLIIKALVQALQQHPMINASIDDEKQEIVLKKHYHIGIATATPDGLLVPVIRHADQLTLIELAKEINRLVEGGRARTLQLHELRGSTFTISNYGSIGGFFATPIINPGEAGILGLGRIEKRPWVVEDRIEPRPILPISFTADHRLIDGDTAMHFLNTLVSTLEHPQQLLLHMR